MSVAARVRPRLGIGIGDQRLSAVLVRGDTIQWWTVQKRTSDQPLSDALRQLLESYPRLGHFRPVVMVAVGPSSVHVKRASRLPQLANERDVARLIHEHAARFVLHTFGSVVTCAKLATPGSAWLAAFDGAVVDAITSVSYAKALNVSAIAPTVGVLAHVCATKHAVWFDGQSGVVISFENGRATSVRPASRVDPGPAMALVPPLCAVGEQAWEIADAYGATQLSATDSLVLRSPRGRGAARQAPKRSLLAAALTLAALTLVGLGVPPVRDAMTVRHATRQLTVLAHDAAQALAQADSLAAVTEDLQAIANFRRGNRVTLLLLAEFARALPDSVALLSLEIDSAGAGRLSAVAPRAAQVVDAVERVPDLTSPHMIGPVTHRTVGTQPFQEVTMTFSVIANPAVER